MLDFHTHILPGIDDGSKNIEMSIRMIDLLLENDVTTAVASPHFYPEQIDIDGFLEMRNKAYHLLSTEIARLGKKRPNILLGAEVYLTPYLSKLDRLPELCIQDSHYLLLEMPYAIWNEQTFEELYTIITKFDVTVVLAHIERYSAMQKDIEKIDRILGMDVLAQMNADSFIESLFKKNLKHILSFEDVRFLGSDCHSDTVRAPNLKKAQKPISKIAGDERYQALTKDIFNGSVIS